MILLTGAFLAPLFEDLPQATLGAIVIVAVAGFFDFAELRRFARVRRSAIVFAVLALAGVLLLGVLQGLVLAALQSLIYVVARLSRPGSPRSARDPASGAWGRLDRHPDWLRPADVLVGAQRGAADVPERERGQGPRARAARRRVTRAARGRARPLAVDRARPADGRHARRARGRAERDGVELRLADVRAPALEVLTRAGLAERVPIEPTLDAAVQA